MKKNLFSIKSYLRGFSLIELMIALAIFSIILLFVYSIFRSGRTTWDTADTGMYVQQQGRQAIDYMTRELRQSSDSKIDQSAPYNGNTITFQKPLGWNSTTGQIDWSDDITYSLVSGQIVRTASDSEPPYLANDVTNLTFVRNSSTRNIVEVGVSVFKDDISFSLNSQVNLRN